MLYREEELLAQGIDPKGLGAGADVEGGARGEDGEEGRGRLKLDLSPPAEGAQGKGRS